MYVFSKNRFNLGDDSGDLLNEATAPNATLAGLSPLMATGLGLLALAFVFSGAKRGVSKVRRGMRKRTQRRERIQALKSELKQLKA